MSRKYRCPIIAPSELLIYGVLGIFCAAIGFFYIRFFYGMRDQFFHRLRFPRSYKPALGGLMLGGIDVCLPQVGGGECEWIYSASDGNLTLGMMLILVFAKIFATSFTISSGGSGGVFAPSHKGGLKGF